MTLTGLAPDTWRGEPIFVFTTDIDWAPECAIQQLVERFDRENVPLSPFVTHESALLADRYARPEMRKRVGLHPNFLPGSSHGDTPRQVIDTVCRLWPEAVSFRSHCFFDHTHLTDDFARRGFLYDSNLCLFLQPCCVPLRHHSGLVRFPVFWEDDVHFRKALPPSLDVIQGDLDLPGLKVINLHPFIFALNVPSTEFYLAHKHLYNIADPRTWEQAAFQGNGARSLVEDLLHYVRERGYRTTYLYDLYLELLTKT